MVDDAHDGDRDVQDPGRHGGDAVESVRGRSAQQVVSAHRLEPRSLVIGSGCFRRGGAVPPALGGEHLAEGDGDVVDVRPVARLARGHGAQEGHPLRRNAVGQLGILEQPATRRLLGRAGEGEHAGEALQQHEAERVDVARRADLLAPGLLGAQVRHSAGDDLVVGDRLRRADRRDAEVAELGGDAGAVLVERQQDVGGLDVAVHHALSVHVLQPRRRVVPELGDLACHERALVEPALEVGALHELHDVVDAGGGGVGAVDGRVEQRHEIGMVEAGEDVDLVLLALEVDLGRRTRAEHLDGDVAPQELVVGAEHVGHAAVGNELS